jgi:hypothetical protein
MNTRSRKFRGWALVLVALGLLALYGGPRGLALLIPAAILVCYVSQSTKATAIDPRVDNRTVQR